tara:strand:+ start:1018 stop:1197 length:180 start_codon:yes stop_codon:yes gene_type:complete
MKDPVKQILFEKKLREKISTAPIEEERKLLFNVFLDYHSYDLESDKWVPKSQGGNAVEA